MSKTGGGRKFAPKIPAARRKDRQTSVAADGSTASGVPVQIAVKEEDAAIFKKLQEASVADEGWGRGMGRGRGRGRNRYGTAGPTAPTWDQKRAAGAGGVRSAAEPKQAGGGAPGSHGAQRAPRISAATGALGVHDDGGATLPDPTFMKADWEEDDKVEDDEIDAEDTAPVYLEDLFGKDDHHPDLLPHPFPGQPLPNPLDKSRRKLPNLMERPDREYNAAVDLGLFEQDELGESLMLFQMPSVLPCKNQAIAPAAVPNLGTSSAARQANVTRTDVLPAGKVGKLLVFRSGKVKLQLGDVLMDVRPCIPTEFRQDVVAIREKQGTGTWLGEVTHRAAITPDIQQLLTDAPVPQWPRGAMPVEVPTPEAAAIPTSPQANSPPYSPTRKRTVKSEPLSPPYSGSAALSPPTSPKSYLKGKLQAVGKPEVKPDVVQAKPTQHHENGAHDRSMKDSDDVVEVEGDEFVMDPMEVEEDDFVGEAKWGKGEDDLVADGDDEEGE